MKAYYNEIDPFAAAWLRRLIEAGQIAPGDVDERDIRDIAAADLVGYTQCHFFAGIGIWSYALRLAGWDDAAPVWTGSCPCQPFSTAGQRKGAADERHLWPSWHHLIRICRPPVVFGEQVASPDALRWFDLVSADLEGEGYAVGAADLCAAGVGAPHIRQRLFFVADADGPRGGHPEPQPLGRSAPEPFGDGPSFTATGTTAGKLGDAERFGRERRQGAEEGRIDDRSNARRLKSDDGLISASQTGPLGGFWADADWLYCRDEKYRAVEPDTFPLAHGATARVGRLRGYGNSLVAPLAAEFVCACMRRKSDKL